MSCKVFYLLIRQCRLALKKMNEKELLGILTVYKLVLYCILLRSLYEYEMKL